MGRVDLLEYRDEYEDALIVNRLNGGRITVYGGSLADGAHITIARSSVYDQNYPQRWDIKKVGEAGGYNIVCIEKSDDSGNAFCIDVGSDEPTPTRAG